MKVNRIIFLILICSGLIFACSPPVPNESTHTPLDVITLQITPELEGWMPKISQCAASIQGIGIYTQVLTQKQLSLDDADLVLRLGAKKPGDPYVAVMGTEEIVIVGGDAIPTNRLSVETLRSIFSGELNNWADLPEINQEEKEGQPIQTFSYPEGHILTSLFSTAYLEGESPNRQTISFSTPEGLQRAFQEQPFGIGYLLKNQVPDSMKILEITGINNLAAQVYVLAVTPEEPQDAMRQLLLCIQNAP